MRAFLIQSMGNDMAPAYYLMGTSLVGVVAALFLRESAGRHLPGAMPSVDRLEEARAVAALKRTTLASISRRACR